MSEYKGAIITLIPDESYESSILEPHLTVAFMGNADELGIATRNYTKTIMNRVVAELQDQPMNAKVTGRAVFNVDPQYNDGNNLVYVDLIDSARLPFIRQQFEWFSTSNHGFIPHITRAYSNAWVPDLVKPIGVKPIRFNKIGLWIRGDEKYEVEL